ncbi:MAG: HNH endonuclease domain-containing protein [Bacteroidales bacterium]|nr:HNH endonuclease domain-containing protein [Bacteroidales bacterium]
MTKILGLDLGTNSIGWAVVEMYDGAFSLMDQGVRIFSEGVKNENGVESSRASERTSYRSARRIKFRRKLRKYETLMVLVKHKMCPLSVIEVEEWRKSGFQKYPLNPEFISWLRTDDVLNITPYHLRDKASKQKVQLFELGRALYHIAQRRGFLSNRLDQSADGIIEKHIPNLEDIINESDTIDEMMIDVKEYFDGLDIFEKKSNDLDEGEKKILTLYKAFEKIFKENMPDIDELKSKIIARLNRKEDLGEVKKQIHEITQKMEEGNHETLGQYFYSLYNKEIEVENKTTKKKEKINRAKIRNHYTAREDHYLAELEHICKIQGIEGINYAEKLPEKRYNGLIRELYRAIFFQRPLKSQKGSVGKCSLEKSKTRCSISHPDFEEYRMWSYINTIKFQGPEDTYLRFLTLEEKQKLVPKFLRKKDKFNFEDLANELIPKGCIFAYYKSSAKDTAQFIFNYKRKDTVIGCPVSSSLKNIFGEEWNTKKYTYQTKNKKGEPVTRIVDYKDIWHLISVSKSDLYLEEYAKDKLRLDEKRAKSFSKIRMKKDFASLSLNAINKIIPFLKNGFLYSHAVFMANICNIVDESIWSDLYERSKIQNKVVDIIDNYTAENDRLDVINALIKACKINNYYYSVEAENYYRKELLEKLQPYFNTYKITDRQKEVVDELFPRFIEQLKKHEFIAIKRLDEKLLEFLMGKNETGEVFCSDESCIKKLYHPSDIEVYKVKVSKDEHGNEQMILGSPMVSSIKNPMAMRALHQLRKVLNTLIKEGQIDPKTRVHIELARELNDSNRRKGIQDFQNENKKNRELYREEIKNLYFGECKKEIEPTEDDILRYQLWLEQDKKDIYEGGNNISICDIIGTNPKYDIEHTIPRSISQDNSLMNKTLCSQRFNREIKRNKMPIELANYEDIKNRVEHWLKEAEKLSWEIERIVKSTSQATTKEAKDKKIRRRHYLTLKRDYLKGKYERFIMKEPKVGFKNSQIPDTGLITKYARAYLKSYFERVESVKGGMVSEFRKAWGLQPGFVENGNKYYAIKDRSKHTHHTIDAITIACMTKDKYDILAHAWTLEDDPDKENYKRVKELFEGSKPWPTFTQDLKRLEDEILVSHHTPDNAGKQTIKVLRIRGKKQYVAETEKDENGKTIVIKDSNNKVKYKLDELGLKMPRLQQGDTVRGSLHQESIYGRIKTSSNHGEIRTVIRKNLESLKATDIDNIVDEAVKVKVQNGVKDKILMISSNPKQKNKLIGTIWMNEEKGIPIRKVRIYANSVKNPLIIKDHPALSISRQLHKQKIYAQNNENYCMAIYEGVDNNGKIKRSSILINMFDAGSYFKSSNVNKKQYPISPEKDSDGNPLKYIITKGKMVLLYNDSPSELKEMTDSKILERLFQITQLDVEQSAIKLLHHIEAREKKEITPFMGLKTGMKGGKNIGEHKKYPWIKIGVNSFDCLVEGYDFKITPTSKIVFL